MQISMFDAKSGPAKRKQIVILATGGTIAGTGRPAEAAAYKAGELPVCEILKSIPQAEALADLKLIDLCGIDSNDITFDHYQSIQEHVRLLDADPDVDGIVITHGTDTLEETAFLLNLVLDTCNRW